MDNFTKSMVDMNAQSYLKGRYDCLEALIESLNESFSQFHDPKINAIVQVLEINLLETKLKIGTTNE